MGGTSGGTSGGTAVATSGGSSGGGFSGGAAGGFSAEGGGGMTAGGMSAGGSGGGRNLPPSLIIYLWINKSMIFCNYMICLWQARSVNPFLQTAIHTASNMTSLIADCACAKVVSP